MIWVAFGWGVVVGVCVAATVVGLRNASRDKILTRYDIEVEYRDARQREVPFEAKR